MTHLLLVTPEHVLEPPVDVVDAGVLVETLWVEDGPAAEQSGHGLEGVQGEETVAVPETPPGQIDGRTYRYMYMC